MNEHRDTHLRSIAGQLIAARRSAAALLEDIPEDHRPLTLDETYRVQDLIAADFGPIGGWKIGAGSPDATPMFAPMPAAWMGHSGDIVRQPSSRLRGIEAEIAFRVGHDLPPRAQPYTREEVLDAMASCHPAIEVLESGLVDPFAASRDASLADLQIHGGFFPGDAIPNWKAIDFKREAVSVTIDGEVRVERVGSNTSGDLVRLLPFLANEGAARTGGLHAGQWITTGSWTGSTPAGPDSDVAVQFQHCGQVRLVFAS